MELPIRGVAAQQAVSGIGGQKRQRRDGDPEFELELDSKEESPNDQPTSRREEEDLPTAGASADEAGSRLDVTA